MSCEHLVMSYSTFSKEKNDALKEPMFFGQPVNVARYDQQKYEVFEKLIEKQLSFFWRPEEIDVSRDRIDYANLPDHEKHIFISNLKYQTLLDSIQGAADIACYYDDLIEYTQYYNLLGEGEHRVNGKTIVVSLRDLKKKLYLCLMCVNVLEAIRFYVSFACSFAFAERELMEGNAKIIKLIARDEALHLTSTQHMLNLMRSGTDDPEMAEIAAELENDCFELFKKAAEQEKEWAEYLFKDGSMIGLNKDILCQYVEYITNHRMMAVGLNAAFPAATQNPIPWINAWLSSDNVQVAPQEVEISSYLIGQIDAEVSADDLGDFEL